jgi:hypothetical protein
MLRKIFHPVLALTLAAGMGITTAEQAQAGRGAGIAAGIAAGIIGLGIIGATAGSRRGYYYDAYDDGPGECYRGPRTCSWENRHCFENRYGDYVCRGGDYVCRRPLICD